MSRSNLTTTSLSPLINYRISVRELEELSVDGLSFDNLSFGELSFGELS